MIDPQILNAIMPVIAAFNQLGIEYYIGGSVASSIFGIARMTLDADIIADVRSEHAGALADILMAKGYYADAAMMRDAIKRRSSFNLIHTESMLKIDVFVLKDTPYAGIAFQRKIQRQVDDADSHAVLNIGAPEDILLNKLEWYRLGGQVSDRQWNDVIGLIKVRAGLLDKGYMDQWAGTLHIADLLDRAYREAGQIV
jgi:hypothetical protein